MSPAARVQNWLDERFGWAELIAPLKHKTVPHHRLSYWYFLGGMTLFLFLIQVATGILLLLYYRPSANEAFESVQYISTQVRFGWLIRSIHSWSANLMVFMAFAHMFSVLFLRAYRKPRELTWVSGALLLFLVLGFGFSGYLLPWNTLAFFATKVGTEVAGQVPIIGPGITTVLLGLHVALVQRFGISVPPNVEQQWANRPQERREMRFFPNFLLRELMAWYIALGALGVLAAIYPWGLGTKADPFAPAPAGIKPEWYFLFAFQTLKLIPAKVLAMDGEVLGVLAFGAAGAIWVLLPFLEQGKTIQRTRPVLAFGVLALAYIAGMTVYGYVAK